VLFAVPSKEEPELVTSPVAIPIVRGVARAVEVAASVAFATALVICHPEILLFVRVSVEFLETRVSLAPVGKATIPHDTLTAAILGRVIVGEPLSTTVEPEPVVVAALIAVQFPARTGEFIEVESVIAGVVVAFATLPAKPLAEATETVVTVPEPLAVLFIVKSKPFEVGEPVIVTPVPCLKLRSIPFAFLTPSIWYSVAV
jgi:hypothetical protein